MHAIPVVYDFLGTAGNAASDCRTVLDAKSEMEGRLVCQGPAKIAGKLTGSIVSEAVLIIEQSAVVDADVTAEKIIVHGTVKGRLRASAGITLTVTAVFEGELDAPTVQMEEGARFDGASHVTGDLREADPDTDENIPSPVHKLQNDLESFIG